MVICLSVKIRVGVTTDERKAVCGMNKAEVCTKIVGETGLDRKDAEKCVGAFIETVIEALRRDESIHIAGLGSFACRHCPARKARYPRTGEELSVEAKRLPAFKAGRALKDSVK